MSHDTRFGTLCFYKGAKVLLLYNPSENRFGTLCFYKDAKEIEDYVVNKSNILTFYGKCDILYIETR